MPQMTDDQIDDLWTGELTEHDEKIEERIKALPIEEDHADECYNDIDRHITKLRVMDFRAGFRAAEKLLKDD